MIEGTKTILLVPFSPTVEWSYWLIPKHYFLEADIRTGCKSQFDKRLKEKNNTAQWFWWQFLTTNINRLQNLKNNWFYITHSKISQKSAKMWFRKNILFCFDLIGSGSKHLGANYTYLEKFKRISNILAQRSQKSRNLLGFGVMY